MNAYIPLKTSSSYLVISVPPFGRASARWPELEGPGCSRKRRAFRSRSDRGGTQFSPTSRAVLRLSAPRVPAEPVAGLKCVVDTNQQQSNIAFKNQSLPGC